MQLNNLKRIGILLLMVFSVSISLNNCSKNDCYECKKNVAKNPLPKRVDDLGGDPASPKYIYADACDYETALYMSGTGWECEDFELVYEYCWACATVGIWVKDTVCGYPEYRKDSANSYRVCNDTPIDTIWYQ